MPRCKYHKVKFEAKYFNQKYCLSDDACIKAFSEFVQSEKEKKEKKAWSKKKKVLRDSVETKTQVEKRLEKEINKIVRLLDKGNNCISHKGSLGAKYDAGHLWSVKSNPQIRYHLFNIFAQCVHCNQHLGSNALEYQERLGIIFSEDLREYCLNLKGLSALNLEKWEIKEKTIIARRIVKWIELQDRKFTTIERIELREKFNKEIGIYTN